MCISNIHKVNKIFLRLQPVVKMLPLELLLYEQTLSGTSTATLEVGTA